MNEDVNANESKERRSAGCGGKMNGGEERGV